MVEIKKIYITHRHNYIIIILYYVNDITTQPHRSFLEIKPISTYNIYYFFLNTEKI